MSRKAIDLYLPPYRITLSGTIEAHGEEPTGVDGKAVVSAADGATIDVEGGVLENEDTGCKRAISPGRYELDGGGLRAVEES